MTTQTERSGAVGPDTPDPSAEAPEGALVDAGALARLVEPVRGRLVLGASLSAVSAVCAMVPFVAVAEIGRHLFAAGPTVPATVWAWAIAAVAGTLARMLLHGAATQICHYADAEFRYRTRERLTRHLGALSLGWFTTHGSGEVEKTVTDDVKRIHVLVAHSVSDIASALVSPVVAIGYMLWVDWRMALLVTGFVVLAVVLVMPAMQRGYQQSMDAYNDALSGVTAASVELVAGIEVAKAYGAGDRVADRYTRAVEHLTRICLVWTAATGRPFAALNVLFAPSTLLVWIIATGSVLIWADWMPPADLLPFLAVGVGLPSALLMVGQLGNAMRQAQLAATHVTRVLDTPGMPEPAEPRMPAGHRVTFEDVTFAYDDSGPAVSGIDLALEPGTVTALVGPSGSGKSTLARLIPRFWDTTSGRVTVGGVDVRDIPTRELLGRIAIVFQDVVLLRDTVRANIALGRPGADDEQIRTAARAAQIHEVVEALPQGYDTVLGEDGAHLSGGERQRLTIARAILQDAPIVLLDEATAHADPSSEALIQRALTELGRDRTLLVIAHRLHTVAGAHQIVVMDGGRVVERGTHQELTEADGLYARLCRAQEVREP